MLAGIARRAGTRYSVLVPNRKGMERALAGGHARGRRLHRRLGDVRPAQHQHHHRRAASSASPGRRAGARGKAARARLHLDRLRLPLRGRGRARRGGRAWPSELLALGVDELSIGDTIGVATPNQVARDRGALLRERAGRASSRCTSTTRAARRWPTCWRRWSSASTIFDSSAGGLGGCPYAPGASGNLATEDLLYMLHGMGIETGVDLDGVVEASPFISGVLGKAPDQPLLPGGDECEAEVSGLRLLAG